VDLVGLCTLVLPVVSETMSEAETNEVEMNVAEMAVTIGG
jgi:hypothetical protein